MKIISCKNIASFSSAIAMFAVLMACGSDSVSEIGETEHHENFDIVNDIAKLPKCNAETNGMQVFVFGDSTIRVCADGDWYALQNGVFSDSTIVISNKCTTEPLLDNRGVKILCNGDSIGVVLNGKNGENGSDGKNGEQGLPGERGEAGSNGLDGDDGVGCTAEALPENEGFKVICGGDSVGVVLNGKNGQDHVTSCDLLSIDCFVYVACGKDTVSLNVAAKDETCSGMLALDTEAIALNLEGVGGSSQKGPFLTGSEVVAYELLDGRSLQQTGKTFQGKILNDKGYFDIKTVSLASQYAILIAKGYYLNEVSGNPSSSQITLTALTNLRGRAEANINLLTHLENKRAQFLVIEGKMTVQNAKKKAENEVFDLFHIDSKNFTGYSEDLSVGGTGDADAALLAVSILLQGSRSEAELSALLSSISTAMEETGKWDDESTKLKIADWAMSADTLGLLEKYHKNVSNWKLSQMVAKFEPYLRNFWNVEYGLGQCDNSESSVAVGTVVKPTRGNVNSDVWFTCVDSSDADVGKVWRVATDFEKDTYLLEPGKDGQLSAGYINKNKYYIYDVSISGWRNPADNIEQSLGGCTEGLSGTTGKIGNKVYSCESGKWAYTYNVVELNNICEPNDDGKMSWGTTDVKSLFVCENGKWRKATESELNWDVACLASMENSIANFDGVDYVCHSNAWQVYVPPEPEIEPELEFYDYAIGEKDFFSTKETANYIDTLFVDPRDGKKYKIVRIKIGDYDRVWFAENLRFADSVAYRNLKGQSRCYKEKNGDCTIGGRYYTWTAAVNLSAKWQNAKPVDVDPLITYPHQGICPDGWHIPDSLEYYQLYAAVGGYGHTSVLKDMSNGEDLYGFSALPAGSCSINGKCTIGDVCFWTGTSLHVYDYDFNGVIGTYAIDFLLSQYSFGLDKRAPRNIAMPIRCILDVPEDFSSMTCAKDAELVSGIRFPKKKYVCDADTFRAATAMEMSLNMGCTSYNDGHVLLLNGSGYVCLNSQWIFDPNADVRGLPCPDDGSLMSGILMPENKYVCDQGNIRKATSDEMMVNRLCEEGTLIFDVDNGFFVADYVCKKKKWDAADIFDYTLEQWNVHYRNHEPEVSYGSMTDVRDGRVYKTLMLDGKTWMAENLRYADSTITPNLVGNSKCFDNLEKNCSIAGRLYTWNGAMNLSADYNEKYSYEDGVDSTNHQGICPDGWRLPTAGEWSSLVNSSRTANDMEFAGFVPWSNATNNSGFSVLPSSAYSYSGFDHFGSNSANAFFWTTTEYELSNLPAYVALFYPSGYSTILRTKTDGISVRCIKN